ncbi:MAG: sigma-70 family RNA polymerase sigma factor [Crocinitomicaceae bacterium]
MRVNPVYHQTSDKLQQELDWITNAKRDSECFGPLYKKYHEQIFRYVYQRMDDQELAFDVTSQVFVKAISNLHKYEYRGVPFSSWLYRIAKSELYQAFRDRKARKTINVESMHLFEMIEELEEEDSSENKIRLMKSLRLLKTNDLQIIELRFFERRSYREIGNVLEITENNAKVKAFRALERLKNLVMNKQTS